MKTENQSTDRGYRIAGNILIFLAIFMLIGSAAAKFAHVPKVVGELGAMGFDGGRLTLIAVLELLSAVIFIVPATRALGLLLLSAYMGGAVATHIQHDQSPLQPAFLLSILWLGAWLRHPESLWSLNSRDLGAEFGDDVAPAQKGTREYKEYIPLP